jgi:hypothetical protein
MREKERQEGEKGFFSRTFRSEFDKFPRKERSFWEIKIFGEIKLRRSNTFQEVRTISKKSNHMKDKGESL